MASTLQTTRRHHVEVQKKASVSVLGFNVAESGGRFTMVMLNKPSVDER
jgi:hypothetical protein